MLAYQKLKDAGFLHEPVRCLACGWNCLGPPVENAASDVLSVYSSEVEKSAQCWALLDQLTGPEDVAMSPPSFA
jgi:hypothetical protein